jgi:hypothetical protein
VPDAGAALRDGGTAGGDQDPLDGDGAEAPDGDASVDDVAVHRPACGCRTLGSPAATHAMRNSGRFPGWLLMLSGLSLVAVRIRRRRI